MFQKNSHILRIILKERSISESKNIKIHGNLKTLEGSNNLLGAMVAWRTDNLSIKVDNQHIRYYLLATIDANILFIEILINLF